MPEVTNGLIFEVLKNIQHDISFIKADVHEIKEEIHATRGHIIAIQTDISNLYKGQAELK